MFLLGREADKPFRVALVLVDPCQPSLWIEIEGCSSVYKPWCESAFAFYHDLEEAAKLCGGGESSSRKRSSLVTPGFHWEGYTVLTPVNKLDE